MIAACAAARHTGTEFGLWLARTHSADIIQSTIKIEQPGSMKSCLNNLTALRLLYFYLSISKLLAKTIVFNQPANKIQAMFLFYHFAILDLLAHMIFHEDDPRSFYFCKSQLQQTLKVSVISSVKMFRHKTMLPLR